MTIEVVFHTAEGPKTIIISNVGSCTYDEDSKVLSVYDDDDNDLADFRDWTYWRKTSG